MLNIGFFRGQPNEYVAKYVAGRLVAEGPGLAFYYLKHKTQIVVVPTTSADGHFVFNEVAGDFQEITLQGQFVYRISDPKRAAEALNFALDMRTRQYVADPREGLVQRIANVIQTRVRDQVRSRPLEEALQTAQETADAVNAEIAGGNLLGGMGITLLGIHVVAARPTPEVATALAAEYRESLLRKADEAIYARRADAVQQERKIKENELNNNIALEEQRRTLIDLEGANLQRQAEFEGLALERRAVSRAKAIELEAAARAEGLEAAGRVAGELDALKILALGLHELSASADRLLTAKRAE
jgi:hypothetical protein